MGQAANPQEAFRQQVYTALTRALAEVTGAFEPEGYQLYQQRRYPGEEAGREIICDVVLERQRPGQPALARRWAWCCLDRAEPMAVEDIDAVCAAFHQVDAEQVKCGIATSGVLTFEALQAAVSQGLCVVRLMPADRVRPLLYRPVYQVGIDNAEQAEQRRRRQVERALTEAAFTSISQAVYAMSDGHYFNDLKSLLTYELASDPS